MNAFVAIMQLTLANVSEGEGLIKSFKKPSKMPPHRREEVLELGRESTFVQ